MCKHLEKKCYNFYIDKGCDLEIRNEVDASNGETSILLNKHNIMCIHDINIYSEFFNFCIFLSILAFINKEQSKRTIISKRRLLPS